ncbi:glycosyltransferase family 2 protein [Rhizobium helianthi]|uniref:Glycosyltransferase family 2 protein n=1 Tax=Rhizobium helianthi TaxID=1132695 RepID=A0ABW4M2F4_9HYPH
MADRPGLHRRTTSAKPAFLTLVEDSRESETSAMALLGLPELLIRRLATQASLHGTSLEEELLQQGYMREDAYYGAFADLLGLPFLSNIPEGAVQDMEGLDTQLQTPSQLRIRDDVSAPVIAIVPHAAQLEHLAHRLRTTPSLHHRMVITTPSAVRRAVWAAGASRRVRSVVFELFETLPDASARIVATGKQGMLAGMVLATVLIACMSNPGLFFPLLHILLSSIYFLALMLRCLALILVRQQAPPPAFIDLPRSLPRYSVMVALYREGDMVAQLVRNLDRLEWPRSLLDIKLVCEADDRETLDALASIDLPPHFEVVEVPAFQPRTKPKALSYALGSVRGEFVAVYDAEDRPHPKQLLEAHQRFRRVPREVACLQAPLVIANLGESTVSALFAMEYAALFRGILPMLAWMKMPLPLGGTSNHFRTTVLREVGGWDPFNVTEDADLGMRLFRSGYRSQTLRYQTLEDAPTSYAVWLGQRTRWFKGWFQTWLVVMRHPWTAIREMGLGPMLIFQLMIGGMLVSALLHPLLPIFLLTFTGHLLFEPDQPPHLMAILDLINVVASYGVFLALGFRCMIGEEKRRIGWKWLALPLYWLMVSGAAWRAANELRKKPFFWSKTSHRPSGATEMKE